MKRRRGHNQEEEHMDETWLIPYSDLLTLLLALFIVLFAASQLDQQKFEQISRSLNLAFQGGTGVTMPSTVVPLEQPGFTRNRSDSDHRDELKTGGIEALEAAREQFEIETLDLRALQIAIDEYIEAEGLQPLLSTELNHSELKISISDTALFAPGRADLSTDARELAVAISALLEEFPGYEISISGHTDNVPMRNEEFADNWELSSMRALNFMKVLLLNEALDKTRLSATGYGEYRPTATNETAEGRTQNRRVEVSVIRNTIGTEAMMLEE